MSGPAAEAVREVLAAGGAPEHLAGRVLATLGERAGEALRADPWRLLAVPGVRQDQADGFARALLGPECGPGDERRTRALVTWLLERAAREGHTAVESPVLRAALAGMAVPDPDAALGAAAADGEVLAFHDARDDADAGPARDADADEAPVRVLLGLERYALAEDSLADGLARLTGAAPVPGGGRAAAQDGAAGAQDGGAAPDGASADGASADGEP
ncbi:helix-hairpin-helix domain-containing protein, partial [Streptomyces sp. B1866]|uniref:helix-hairpin-helix domain-containing protein n=1 Tax=Streptomyces sp. B1866 TaxID=3075431 RepID=UPI00288C75C8